MMKEGASPFFTRWLMAGWLVGWIGEDDDGVVNRREVG